jgi:hypothetical protein
VQSQCSLISLVVDRYLKHEVGAYGFLLYFLGFRICLVMIFFFTNTRLGVHHYILEKTAENAGAYRVVARLRKTERKQKERTIQGLHAANFVRPAGA